MNHPKLILLAAGLVVGIAVPASAEIKVVATIGPVHSLVAMVSDGIIEPDLLMQPGASPHYYSMTPSQSALLAESDIVFMVGDGIELWLERPLANLAGEAKVVALGSVEGVTRLAARQSDIWGDKDDDHQEEHDHHSSDGIDPHFWLSPDNAAVWLDAIAKTLMLADPENASSYRTNSEQAAERIAELGRRVDGMLAEARDHSYIVFHDAYQYFEVRFDLASVGAVLLGDTAKPSAARIKRLRDTIDKAGARCVFVEPQFSPAIADTIAEGGHVRIATLDPIGANLSPGTELYPKLLENLARSLADCLGGHSG